MEGRLFSVFRPIPLRSLVSPFSSPPFSYRLFFLFSSPSSPATLSFCCPFCGRPAARYKSVVKNNLARSLSCTVCANFGSYRSGEAPQAFVRVGGLFCPPTTSDIRPNQPPNVFFVPRRPNRSRGVVSSAPVGRGSVAHQRPDATLGSLSEGRRPLPRGCGDAPPRGPSPDGHSLLGGCLNRC